MGFPKRVDKNQREIVSEFRKMGASVQVISAVGKGCPDILVGYNKRSFPIEIKNGSLAPSQQKLTPDEQVWHEKWRGDVYIVRQVADVEILLRLINDEGSGGVFERGR